MFMCICTLALVHMHTCTGTDVQMCTRTIAHIYARLQMCMCIWVCVFVHVYRKWLSPIWVVCYSAHLCHATARPHVVLRRIRHHPLLFKETRALTCLLWQETAHSARTKCQVLVHDVWVMFRLCQGALNICSSTTSPIQKSMCIWHQQSCALQVNAISYTNAPKASHVAINVLCSQQNEHHA